MTAGAAPEERETKLSVPDRFVMPPLVVVGGVDVRDEGERELTAVYWDSDDLCLAHAGVGLRHRDGVWTFKGVSRRDGDAVVREEREVEADGRVIPAELRDRVAAHGDPSSLRPVATVRTRRHTRRLTRDDATAELVHDRVTVLAPGGATADSFSEVEVESDATGASLADEVAALLVAHGARVDPTPKLIRALRALGYQPPEVVETPE